MSINYNELVQLALFSRQRAYAPYSNFKVGAYLLDVNDECYYGCNIENASYSATIAEIVGCPASAPKPRPVAI